MQDRRISTVVHEMRDAEDGLQLKLTVHLPEAAPEALIEGHLHHYMIEWRNWTRMALAAV